MGAPARCGQHRLVASAVETYHLEKGHARHFLSWVQHLLLDTLESQRRNHIAAPPHVHRVRLSISEVLSARRRQEEFTHPTGDFGERFTASWICKFRRAVCSIALDLYGRKRSWQAYTQTMKTKKLNSIASADGATPTSQPLRHEARGFQPRAEDRAGHLWEGGWPLEEPLVGLRR